MRIAADQGAQRSSEPSVLSQGKTAPRPQVSSARLPEEAAARTPRDSGDRKCGRERRRCHS